LKEKSGDYREGYGQAKADLLLQIGKAFKLIHNELAGEEPVEVSLSDENRKEILAKQEALKWVRSMIKGLKSK